MSRITDKLQGKKGLIAYVTAGYPDYETCEAAVLAAVRGGADVVELGVPFSDPMADGPVIAAAGAAALAGGATVQKTLALAARLRRQSDVPLVIMTYLNPVLAYGVDDFCRAAAAAGVDGLILPDVPEEEADVAEEACRQHGLARIRFLAPTTTPERVERICAGAEGFVYCIARAGVTGVAEGGTDQGLQGVTRQARQHTKLPLAVGFGIGDAASAREAAQQADAVIVGSAIVSCLEKEGPAGVERFVRTLRQALDEVKQ